MTSLPSKIKAVLQSDIQINDLTLTELPIQLAQEGTNEHLVKVYATSPCAGELTWARLFPSIMDADKVGVPCYDLSGVVISAPTDSPFSSGTEVYTRTAASRTGNLREYTIAHTSELALKPKNLSWEEAASIPLSLFTAYQALFEHGGLQPAWQGKSDCEAASARAENAKKRVLVTASAGGVGVLVVQLARACGVNDIIGITGPDNVEFVKTLGVTEVINYRQQSLADWARAPNNPKVDLVIDMVGGQILTDSWLAVRDGGILLSINASPEEHKPAEGAAKDVTNYFFIMEPKGWQLKDVAELVESGEVKPVVDSVWNFEQFREAFAKMDGGHARGKIIIKVVAT